MVFERHLVFQILFSKPEGRECLLGLLRKENVVDFTGVVRSVDD